MSVNLSYTFSNHRTLLFVLVMAHYHPAKRRRTKHNDRLHEDDTEALDALTIERVVVDSKTGPKTKRIFVPIPSPPADSVEDNNKNDHPGIFCNMAMFHNDEMNHTNEPEDDVIPVAKTKKA